MDLTTKNLAKARQATSLVLEQIGLEAYLFEIEPREENWELRVECATEDGWQTLTLLVEESLLQASRQDAGAHSRLLEQWRARFGACKTQTTAPKGG